VGGKERKLENGGRGDPGKRGEINSYRASRINNTKKKKKEKGERLRGLKD